MNHEPNKGHIRLYRKATESDLVGCDLKVWGMFSYLLLRVNWKAKKCRGEWVYPGSLITSIHNLSDAVGESQKVVRRVIAELQKHGILKSENWANRGTKLTICNWGTYQTVPCMDGLTKGTTTGATKGRAKGTQLNKLRNKERKNVVSPHKPPQKSFKTWSEEELRTEVENANHDNILTAEEVDDFVGYWRECDENGKTLIQKQKSWDTRRRMLNAIKCVYSKRRQQPSPSPSGNLFLDA